MQAGSRENNASNNIIPARERVRGRYRPAVSLRRLGIGRILGREIIGWHHSLGSYGMGGPGFFGLHFAPTDSFPDEWLVLTLWAADNWLLFDGHWVAAHPNQYHVQHPLVSYFGGDEEWDELSDKLIHATIIDAEIRQNASRIDFEKGGVPHVLEIPEDTGLLPLHGGSLAPHQWKPDESQLDAWIISESGELLI
jgi:hypothetical protein